MEEKGKLHLACLKFLTELSTEYINGYWKKKKKGKCLGIKL